MGVKLRSPTPALPAKDVPRARDFYVDLLGFEAVAGDEGFVLLRRDERVLQLEHTFRDRLDGGPHGEHHR